MNPIKLWFNWRKNSYQAKRASLIELVKQWKSEGHPNNAAQLEKKIRHLDELQMYLENDALPFYKSFWYTWSFSSFYSNTMEWILPVWRQIVETIVYVGGTVWLIKLLWFGLYYVPTGSAEPNILVGDRICGVKYPYLLHKPERGDLVIFEEPFFPYDSNPIKRFWQKHIGWPFLFFPAGPQSWTKRLIGLPGDRVEGRINERGGAELYVNGVKIDEPFKNPYPLIHLKRKSGFLPFNIQVGPFSLASKWQEKSMLYTYDPTKPFDQQPFYNFKEEEIIRDQFGNPEVLLPNVAGRWDKFSITVPAGHYWLQGDNRHNSRDNRYGFGVTWRPYALPENLILGRASFILYSLDGVEDFWVTELIKNPITFFTNKVRWSRIFRFVHPLKEIPKS